VYEQDDRQVTPNLTLNSGARYEFNSQKGDGARLPFQMQLAVKVLF